jgi:hypothetical protein
MKIPRKIILTRMTFLIMKTDFVPFLVSDIENTVDNSFVPISDVYPNVEFESWNKENWEEMKTKNAKKSVDSFKPLW